MTNTAPKLVTTSGFKIEKAVPLPDIVGAGGPAPTFPFAEMEVGDSIVIPKRSRAAAYSWARYHSRKFTTRPEGADVRVWRTA